MINNKTYQNIKKGFIVFQKALIQTFHTSFLLQNNFYEFTTQEHEFKNQF